jgi:hypothetical protein
MRLDGNGWGKRFDAEGRKECETHGSLRSSSSTLSTEAASPPPYSAPAAASSLHHRHRRHTVVSGAALHRTPPRRCSVVRTSPSLGYQTRTRNPRDYQSSSCPGHAHSDPQLPKRGHAPAEVVCGDDWCAASPLGSLRRPSSPQRTACDGTCRGRKDRIDGFVEAEGTRPLVLRWGMSASGWSRARCCHDVVLVVLHWRPARLVVTLRPWGRLVKRDLGARGPRRVGWAGEAEHRDCRLILSGAPVDSQSLCRRAFVRHSTRVVTRVALVPWKWSL